MIPAEEISENIKLNLQKGNIKRAVELLDALIDHIKWTNKDINDLAKELKKLKF